MSIDKNLLERLKNNDPSLIELDLSNQNPSLTAEDMRLLIEALASNSYLKKLFIEHNYKIRDEGIKALAQNQTLTTLNVWGNQIGAEGAKALAANQTLTTLNIRGNQIGAEGAKALAQNQTLTTLDISYNQIGDEGAKVVAQNKTLTTLKISFNQICDEGAKALAQNQNLTNLDFRWNFIDDQLIQTIEQRIAMNRQAIIQKRNHFVIATLILLRQERSATPLEIRQLICQFLNFPSMQVSNRSGKEMVEFVRQNLPEFNARLRNKVSPQMIENMKPQTNQSRFSFFVPRTATPAVPEMFQEPQENYNTAVKK